MSKFYEKSEQVLISIETEFFRYRSEVSTAADERWPRQGLNSRDAPESKSTHGRK